LVADRQVWIGNAAQTLHPVAGQGFNLALRDIHQLARIVAQAEDPGAPEVLADYARRRRIDRKGVMIFTDLLVRLFSNDNPLLRHARGAGLLALDLLPPARSFVARRLMLGARGW
jgi:2-octaprenyl-6-methoxyphenol hydroxylase